MEFGEKKKGIKSKGWPSAVRGYVLSRDPISINRLCLTNFPSVLSSRSSSDPPHGRPHGRHSTAHRRNPWAFILIPANAPFPLFHIH